MNYSEQINACAKNEIQKVNRTFCSSKIDKNVKGSWQDHYMKSKEEKEILELKRNINNKKTRLKLLNELSQLDKKINNTNTETDKVSDPITPITRPLSKTPPVPKNKNNSCCIIM